MRLLNTLFLFILILPTTQAFHFNYSQRARDAYEYALALRFGEARELLRKLKKEEPGNLAVYHIENYIDFLTVYINEDEAEYKRLRVNRDLRLAQVEKGNSSSPYYLFVQADIRLQWALVRLKFDDYLGAFTEVNRAYKLLARNQERFKDFMPTYKDLGILHAMVGTIPDNYRWGLKLLSNLDGTIEQGRRELERVLDYSRDHDFIFAKETAALYSLLLLHLENNEEAAWQNICRAGLDPRTNLLHCFVKANIAMRTDHNDEAISLLMQRPKGNAYFPFHYMDFMLGNAKLRRLDDDADIYIRRFVEQFKGKNFIKEAYQKLAWYELTRDDPAGYRRYMQSCLTEGNTIVGSDDSAFREAKEQVPPDPSLVRARLLFDGGYFNQAYWLLSRKNEADFSGKHSKLEFFYRMGRVLHGKGDYPEALEYYERTIKEGRDEPYYFACNAALQSGMIYEKRGQREQAIRYYNTCLSIKPEEHRTGLHQRAKAGLMRMSEAPMKSEVRSAKIKN